MKIAIAGVAGFIGTNFARYIAEKYPYYKMIGIDNLSKGSNRSNLKQLEESGRLDFRYVSILDDNVESILKKSKVDAVVNFAAESHNDRAILSPSEFAQTNAYGAQLLLEVSRNVGIKKHIHISTIEVYGEQESSKFTEGSPLNAKTPYSAAKAAGDMLVRAYMHTYPKMDIALTHCANNYGPYQSMEKFIPSCITKLLRGECIELYGDGMQERDWIHVDDHSKAIDLILHSEKQEIPEKAKFDASLLPIYDIAARNVMTNLNIASVICGFMGADPVHRIKFIADRPNHDKRYEIDPTKIEQSLGFEPTIEFVDGIEKTIQWYKDNKSWWEPQLTKDDRFDWGEIKVHGLN